jgi:hypothetical protein
MSERNNKRATTTAVKALIATASVAATIAGWAMLPSNDPSAAATAASTDQSGQLPSLTLPGDVAPQAPSTGQDIPALPDSQLPQVQAPQGFSNRPSPFTRTHSSR